MQGSIVGRFRTLICLAVALAVACPAAASACERDGAEPSELTVKEARAAVLCLVNERRRANGLARLRDESRLERAAQRHSNSMDESNFFSHNGPGGSSPLSRIRSTGYISGASSWAIAENIRWGSGSRGSAKAAVASWMNSASHRSALLENSYRHIGIGVALGSPTGGGEGNTAIYTTTFGYRR
jgi:uncharacterized protein YkwD